MTALDKPDTAPLHAGTTVPADPVPRFLQAHGWQSEIAFLGESAFELGRRVRVGGLDLIYRFEHGTLLLCDIAAYAESEVADGVSDTVSSDPGGAMRTLVSLIHAIERAVPEVQFVEGLVPITESAAGEADLGRRLLGVYRKLGAQCQPHELADMVQVRYTMQGGLRQDRTAQP